MTTDLNMQPLTSSTYRGTPVASLAEVWLQHFKETWIVENLTKMEHTLYINTPKYTHIHREVIWYLSIAILPPPVTGERGIMKEKSLFLQFFLLLLFIFEE